MSEMVALAVPAGEWVQATVTDATEVTIAALGASGLIMFVGAEEPSESSDFGLPIDRGRDRTRRIESGDAVWLRSSHPAIATRALVWAVNTTPPAP